MAIFKPTEDQIRLAEALMVAMAFEATIRPIVVAYETAILEKHRFPIARKWVEMGVTDRIILDRKDSYLLSEADAKVFHAECLTARDAAKLKVENPEYCPLLVAEHLRLDAERALLKAMAATPGLEAFGKGFMTLEQRARALDLIFKLVAPFCAKQPELMQRYAGAVPEAA